QDRSIATSRSMKEIAAEAEGEGAVWLPGKGIVDPEQLHQLYFEGERLKPQRKKKVFAPKKTADADVEVIQEAPKELIPRKMKPMIAKKGGELFEDPDFLFGLNYGGKRAIAELHKGHCTLLSRSGLDFRKKHPTIHEALSEAAPV